MSASLKQLTTYAPVTVKRKRTRIYSTSNSQRLWSVSDSNNWRSKCSQMLLLQHCTCECHLWSKYMVSDYDGRRSKRAWPNCVLCIPFMFSGIPNECWLHTWDTCNNNLEIRIMGSSWRTHNLVIHVAQNRTKYLNNQLYKNTSESIDQRNEVIKKNQYSPPLNGASRLFLTKFWRLWDVLPICELPQCALAMMMATGR